MGIGLGFLNNFSTKLTNAITSTDVDLLLDSYDPQNPDPQSTTGFNLHNLRSALVLRGSVYLTISNEAGTDYEVVELTSTTSVGGSIFYITVLRSVKYSTPKAWPAGSIVEIRLPANVLEEMYNYGGGASGEVLTWNSVERRPVWDTVAPPTPESYGGGNEGDVLTLTAGQMLLQPPSSGSAVSYFTDSANRYQFIGTDSGPASWGYSSGNLVIGKGAGGNLQDQAYYNGGMDFGPNGHENTIIGSNAASLGLTYESSTALGSRALISMGELPAFMMEVGRKYIILDSNNINFVSFGATSNDLGHKFTCIAVPAFSSSAYGTVGIADNYPVTRYNVGIGSQTGYYFRKGEHNTFINTNGPAWSNSGASSSMTYAELYSCTFIGVNAGSQSPPSISTPSIRFNMTCIGAGSNVSGDDQVQLGNSGTTTYVYGTVQNRSDLRDKADVRDTVLGLDFIESLRPVDYRWDMRDSYRLALPNIPTPPLEALKDLPADADEAAQAAYAEALTQHNEAMVAHEQAMEAFNAEMTHVLESNKLENIVRDGSKKRNRYHHGLIAQEIKATIDKLGVDFGGFQDHSVGGGDDVMSIGYDELVGPLIKAVQELSARVKALESKIANP